MADGIYIGLENPRDASKENEDSGLNKDWKDLVGQDGIERLAHILYGRDAKASEWLGGPDAKILHDAATELEKRGIQVAQNTSRLQIMWERLQSICKKAGVEPSEDFFNWFDRNGVPITFGNQITGSQGGVTEND